MSSAELTIQKPTRRVPIWPAAILPLSGVVAWTISAGGQALKGLFLGLLAWLLALPLFVSLEAGLMAMMLFEPMRGFLRRAQYIFLPYTDSDPIHIVTPLVTIMAFTMLVHRRGLGILRDSPLAGMVSILALIYFLQIFNPLQGSLNVGFSGALFVLVPVAWFYFGQTIKPQFLETAFRLIVVLGVITSLYGIYQLAIGFPSFEQYWIDNTDFYNSISVGKVERALATYSSAEEWGRYIELGAIISFGFGASAFNYLRRGAWFLCGGALTLMVLFTGQRTAIFGLILGALVLFLLGAKSWRGIAGRLLLAVAPALLIGVLVQAPTNDDMLSHGQDEKFQAVLSHTARGTLKPQQEESLQERFKNWTYLATDVMPYRPFGMGLGATSIGAYRDSSAMDLPPIDSYFISSALTCGLPTALLLIWILIRGTSMSWRGFHRAEAGSAEARLWRIAAAIMPVLILNNMFGNTLTLYSVAPIGWLLVGWISASHLREMVAARSVETEESLAMNQPVQREQLAA